MPKPVATLILFAVTGAAALIAARLVGKHL